MRWRCIPRSRWNRDHTYCFARSESIWSAPSPDLGSRAVCRNRVARVGGTVCAVHPGGAHAETPRGFSKMGRGCTRAYMDSV